MRRPLVRAFGLTALCAASFVAGAQKPSALDARRAAVTASQARLMQLLNIVTQDSIRRATLPIGREYAGMKVRVDTTQIPREFLETLDDAYAAVLKDAVRAFGPAAHALLSQMNGSIVRGASWESIANRGMSRYVSMSHVSRPGPGPWAQTLDAFDANEATLVRIVAEWFARAAYAEWPAPVQSWSSRPYSFAAEHRDASAYSDVRYAGVQASQQCLDGKNQACRDLLAIEPANDTVGTWMSSDERRNFIGGLRFGYWRRRSRDGVDPRDLQTRCVQAREDTACRDALRFMHIGAPVSGSARARLVFLAIELGGPEAFDRLRGARADDIGTILATTAGVPLDSLISAWRARLVTARPHSPAPDGRELLIGCVLIIGTLAVSVGRRP